MKFYLIEKDSIVIKNHHKFIGLHYESFTEYSHLIINLTNEELKELYSSYSSLYDYFHFKHWRPHNFSVSLWEFLITKHAYNIPECWNGINFGINSFYLDEYDIMYIKLLL